MAQPPVRPGQSSRVIDAVVVEIRDGRVANRPVYAVIGVSVDRFMTRSSGTPTVDDVIEQSPNGSDSWTTVNDG